jgi:hypothetical protein
MSLKLFFILIGIVVVLIGALLFFYSNERNSIIPKEYIVELSEDGFEPKEITINRGDIIKFITSLEKPFWPASNLHPSHTIYSEFDPREPIELDESWSFKFMKSGTWKYHDHLAPIYKGEIIILEKRDVNESVFIADTCKNGKRQQQCWEELVSITLATKGVESALDILYESQNALGRRCHDLSHLIGEEAYDIFFEGKEITLTSKTYYCGYGFYHGFMEQLLHTTGSLEEAREFCAYADSQLTGQTGDVGGSCYHGIGHGVVDGGDPRNWGDVQAVIAPGLELCENVGDTDTQIDRCASGVFNSLAIAFNNSSYGLSINKEDPYWICEKQTKHYFKKPCYEEMNTIVMRLGATFKEAAKYTEKIADNVYAEFAIQGLASYAPFFYSYGDDYTRGIEECRGIKERLQIPCITGFAAGLVEHAAPKVEHVQSLNFCQSEALNEIEQQACFGRIMFYLGRIYSEERVGEICKNLTEEYRKYCSYNL